MGIKDYHKWMKQKHPDAFNSKWLNTYDHMYIDLNFALHWAHYGAKNENQILGKLFALLDKIIFKVHPTKSITLANDGAAPVAKLLLQRNRRSDVSRTIDNFESSSLIFTPGTKFMTSIQPHLEKYMKKIELLYNVETKYIINCEGEAELKLKKKMMDNIDIFPDDTHIIISNDADIIAMFGTFNPKSYFNIFIYCDLRNDKDEIMSMGMLMHLHTNKYGMSKNFGKDFTLMSIFLGNDYLPKIAFSDLDKLWNAYMTWISEFEEGLVLKNMEINVDFFKHIIISMMSKTKNHLLSRFNLNEVKPIVYQSYCKGLLWCLDMYDKGQCICYNYMYDFDDVPHPLGLLFNLYLDPKILKCKIDPSPSINEQLYSILVFPKKAINLIDKKYHEFAQSCNILYEEEDCELCNNFYEKMKNYDKTDQKYKIIQKELKSHKNDHMRLNTTDIDNIVSEFTEEFC